MTDLEVQVLGEPIPQGSMRAVGRGRMVSDNDRLRPWRDTVAWNVRHAMAGKPPLEGPVKVSATFVLPRPKSAPKRRWAPDRKPDIDKLLRATFDAITTGAGWVDDAQAVIVETRKVYANDQLPPQLILTVSVLEQAAA